MVDYKNSKSIDFNESRSKYTLLIKTIFSLLAAALISSLNLDPIESYLFDLRVRTKAFLGLSNVKESNIALVMINSKTVERYNGYPTFADHTKFLEKLITYDPKFVVYDFVVTNKTFVGIEGPESEQLKFAFQTQQFENFFVATQDLEMKGEEGKLKFLPPLDVVKLEPAPRTADNTLYGKDGVSRRLMLSYQDQKMLQPKIASYYNPTIQNFDAIKGKFDVFDSVQTYIHFHPSKNFPRYTFEDIVNGQIPKDALKGKIVLVGSDTGASSKDYSATPLTRIAEEFPTKTEIQANIFQTLIDNNAPVKLPPIVGIIMTVLISALTVYVTLALKPARGLVILGSTLGILAILATLAFLAFDLWFDLAHPFLAIFLCYYFFIPYRLIKENRRSWEYYQKHKLLSEVEQLKTNFISMMSHDLKTPIARITGMTEVIYKDPVQLSPHQREALDTIRHSSDDLLKFINAILQYGSIESQGVQLHKQSKDINALVAEVVKKHQFLANVKKIKIIQELEPMFPTSVDPELMKQVFSNLLENAIKYSPEESMVHIRTREDNDSLIIEFQDQGMGIPQEDLPNIFMKFFRTHNAKTTTIKGSGLGLYLAQYFVELHKGKITVDSSQDKGSKFTVELPLDK